MPLSDYLPDRRILLGLESRSKQEALRETLGLFRGEPGVNDAAALASAVEKRDAPTLFENHCGILIAHGRTNAVEKLVMAVGRCKNQIIEPGAAAALRLVFVAGIPSAFDSEYLRSVGAIARICRNPETLQALLECEQSSDFAEILNREELAF